MSEVKGKLLTCDRCGETVFLRAISDESDDGGYTRWNTFEDAPEDWEWHTEAGALCPVCSKTFKSILKAFMNRKSFTIY